MKCSICGVKMKHCLRECAYYKNGRRKRAHSSCLCKLLELKKHIYLMKNIRHDEQGPSPDDDLVEKIPLDYLEYWTSSCEADCSGNQCPVGIKDALKECHLAYDKICKLLQERSN